MGEEVGMETRLARVMFALGALTVLMVVSASERKW